MFEVFMRIFRSVCNFFLRYPVTQRDIKKKRVVRDLTHNSLIKQGERKIHKLQRIVQENIRNTIIRILKILPNITIY